jgi:hypothetical protein
MWTTALGGIRRAHAPALTRGEGIGSCKGLEVESLLQLAPANAVRLPELQGGEVVQPR